MTNFGLTMRLKAENIEQKEFERILKCEPFELEVSKYLENPQILNDKYGKVLAARYEQGLKKFINDFNLDTSELKLIGPSIEGVGEYPEIDFDLKVKNEDIYAIGDCSGIFRGIIPSMLSGHYLALKLEDNKEK